MQMTKRPRDSQRSKVYRSEDVLPVTQLNGKLPRDTELAEVQAFVDHITASKTWRKVCLKHHGIASARTVTVKDGRGRQRGWGGPHSIMMPRWTRYKSYVLHELSHTAVCWAQDSAAHGWRFCDAYLTLVARFLGANQRDRLKQAYKDNRVRFRPKIKRNVSPEQREATRQRMLAFHANKREKSNHATA